MLPFAFSHTFVCVDVLGLDILDRHYNADTGILTSYRVSLIRGMMPSWVCAITGGCFFFCCFLFRVLF